MRNVLMISEDREMVSGILGISKVLRLALNFYKSLLLYRERFQNLFKM